MKTNTEEKYMYIHRDWNYRLENKHVIQSRKGKKKDRLLNNKNQIEGINSNVFITKTHCKQATVLYWKTVPSMGFKFSALSWLPEKGYLVEWYIGIKRKIWPKTYEDVN